MTERQEINKIRQKLDKIAIQIRKWNCENVYILAGLMNEFEEVCKDLPYNYPFNSCELMELHGIDITNLNSAKNINYRDTFDIYAWDKDGDVLAYDNGIWYVINADDCKNRL